MLNLRAARPPRLRPQASWLAGTRRKIAAGLVISTIMGVTAASTWAAAAQPAATAQQASQATIHTDLAAGSYPITLITGDRATLVVGQDRRVGVNIEPATRADGSIPTINWYSTGDGVYVIPADVQSYIDAGQIDEKLFDVEYLAANNYQANAELPLIVEYAGAVKPLAATAATVPLKSVAAASVTVKEGRLHDFWKGLVKGKPSVPGPEKAAARTSTLSTALPSGVERIWLDRVAKVVLEQSVPQINAPQAWQAGYTGSGIKVAILDTGIDTTHPDLAGKVIASRSFVADAAQPIDDHGHGTHVASTVAGTGAASGGKYVGVAPDAGLIIGKVCDRQGACHESDVIAGMEWAAIDQDADVVNLSLGGCCTDGTDPQSQVVNALTAQTGALFVIAAGNTGPGTGSINSPGVAEAALTVGAVSKSEELASFSSRGPRSGSLTLKPEITAPGVDIVAARAAGTSMGTGVGEHYTSASGTSMATPHVAGAAALLAQQNPGWTAPQLKAALVSSAQDGGYNAYEQGAGRVDIGRAVRQRVQVSPAVADFGFMAEPTPGPALTRTLTYTNPTEAAITLNISASLRNTTGAGLPDGTFNVDSTTLSVPAGASASVTATLLHSGLGTGMYTGSVVATNAETGLRLTTPAGFTIGARKHRLTVTAVSRDCENGVACIPGESSFWFGVMYAYPMGGAQGQAATTAQATRIALRPAEVPGETRTYQAYLPEGRYFLHWMPGWQDATSNRWQSAEIIAPQLRLTGDTQVHLDANTAVKTEFEVPKPVGENITATRLTTRLMSDGSVGTVTGSTYAWGAGNMWSNPIGPLDDGALLTSFGGTFTEPQLTMTVAGSTPWRLDPIYPGYYPQGYPHHTTPVRFPAGTAALSLANAGRGTAEDLANVDVKGKLALVHNDLMCVVPPDMLQRLLDAGAAGVLFDPKLCRVPNYIYPLVDNATRPQIPYVAIPMGEAERLATLLAAGPVQITVTSLPVPRYTYYLSTFEQDGVPGSLRYRFGDDSFVTIDARYHSAQDAWFNQEHYFWHPGEPMQIGQNYAFNVPSTMTEYWSVDPQATVWRHIYDGELGPATLARVDVFAKPQRRVEDWNSQPMVPGAAVSKTEWTPICAGCRDGDTFFPQVYLTNDNPAYTAGLFGLTIPVSTGDDPWHGLHLYRDGNEIPMTPFLGFFPAYALPPDNGRYQLVMDADAVHNRPRTVWDFVSRATADSDMVPGEHLCLLQQFPAPPSAGCRAEPLIFLRYSGLDLNLRHQALAPGGDLFEVLAYRQASTAAQPRIAGLKLWTSYDGGSAWQEVVVVPKGDGRFAVFVAHPPASHRASDTVTIRAEAWDRDGNRVQQTIRQAFQLIERPVTQSRGDLAE